ncbi:MAG: hypothetical protein FWC86_04785 [Coriobacteriia bacterium]|nr:hypothetical protein [Coriobacteriia bacterium]
MKKKETLLISNISNLEGGLRMKKIVLALALTTALLFAFAVTAQATYRGFTPIRSQEEMDNGALQGFITFAEAQAEMARNIGPNDPGASLQGTVHGGYITTTTKCVVCHSGHRASGYNPEAQQGTAASSVSGDINLSNVQSQSFITAGATSCNGCHVNTGAQASQLLVEWGGNGGPHAAPNRGCTLCHSAGIHGLSSSAFNVMNVYMLGEGRKQNLRGSDWPADGQWLGGDPITRDEQIRKEIEEARILRGETLDVPASSPLPGVLNPTSPNGSTWWYDGVAALGPLGGVPTGFPGAPNVNQFAAARSLATAYTCGESGCHSSTAMFNLNWGMGFERIDRVRDPATGAGVFQSEPVMVTGHVLPSVRVSGSNVDNLACGPCHAGHSAGFPTASTVEGRRDGSRRAYGCDQCHDMVGVATNSTAWPHGNRGIRVYEWMADGQQVETEIPGGFIGGTNLWMYGGSIARADHDDVPISDGSQTATDLVAAGGGAVFRGPNSENISFADQSWMVLTGVTAGRYGLPGHGQFPDDPDGPFGNPQIIDIPGTGLVDGSCLKCHVPLDSQSREAMGSVGADALRHAWNRGGNPDWGDAANPKWSGGTSPINSSRLFLYR